MCIDMTYKGYYYDDCYMHMQVWCYGTSVLSEDNNYYNNMYARA